MAVRDGERWQPAIKVSESPQKTPNPGDKHVWRIYDQRGKATADLLSLKDEDPRQMETVTLRHTSDHSKQRALGKGEITLVEPLLVDVLQDGKPVYDLPSIEQMREQRMSDVDRLDTGVRRLINPHIYHVSLSQKLWDLKQSLIESALEKSK